MVARNFDQWTSTSCACVGRKRGRRTLHCEWWVWRSCWIGGLRLMRWVDVGLAWLCACPPRSEVNWLVGQVDVCYLYVENEGFVNNSGRKLRV